MVQNFKQIIYHCPESDKNFPLNLTPEQLIDGSIFLDYMPLSQLGVRALPGTKFYVNGSSTPVIIGFTGMFDIDLTEGGFISDLKFDTTSIKAIQQNDSAYLVVDMAYLGGN